MKKRLSIVSVLGFLLMIKDVSADIISPLSPRAIKHTFRNLNLYDLDKWEVISLIFYLILALIVILVMFFIFKMLSKLIKRIKNKGNENREVIK